MIVLMELVVVLKKQVILKVNKDRCRWGYVTDIMTMNKYLQVSMI